MAHEQSALRNVFHDSEIVYSFRIYGERFHFFEVIDKRCPKEKQEKKDFIAKKTFEF